VVGIDFRLRLQCLVGIWMVGGCVTIWDCRGGLGAGRAPPLVYPMEDRGLALVTTLPALLARRYEQGISSPGVILVSARSFGRQDIGGVARALATLVRDNPSQDWAGQVVCITSHERTDTVG
jgi:hypothetical protein